MAKDTVKRTPVENKRLVNIGLRIRAIREEKNLTLEGVEDNGYPSWKHLQAIEQGRKNFTVTSLFRLAKALGIASEKIIADIK